jgi:hypothetical protein
MIASAHGLEKIVDNAGNELFDSLRPSLLASKGRKHKRPKTVQNPSSSEDFKSKHPHLSPSVQGRATYAVPSAEAATEPPPEHALVS